MLNKLNPNKAKVVSLKIILKNIFRLDIISKINNFDEKCNKLNGCCIKQGKY